MFSTLVKRSFLFHLISLRFAASFVVVVILVGATAALDRRDYKEQVADYEKRTQLHAQWLNAARTYIELVPCLDRKPNPLSSIAAGIGSLFGDTIVIPGWYSPISIVSSSTTTNPFLHSIARMDLSYLVAVVITLSAVFITFDSVSGERERGTLRLQRSMSVPEHLFLAAQYVGALFCVGVSVAAAFVVWFVAFDRGDINLTRLQWQGLLAVFVLSILLASVFMLLGILFSSRMRSSAQSLVGLIFVWAVFVVVAPNLLAQLSSTLHRCPLPSLQVAEGWEPRSVPSQKTPEQGSRSVLVGGVFYPTETYPHQFLAGLYDPSSYNSMMAQYQTYRHLSLLSPVVLYLAATPELAGTDPLAHSRYVDAALRYQESLKQWQEAKVAASPHRSLWSMEGDDPLDKGGLPVPKVYADHDPDMGRRSILAAAGMVMWNLLILAAIVRVSLPDIKGRTGRGSCPT